MDIRQIQKKFNITYLVEACKWVDEVVLAPTYDPILEHLDKNKCSHLAHGDDMIIGPNGEDGYAVFKSAGRMKQKFSNKNVKIIGYIEELKEYRQLIQWVGYCLCLLAIRRIILS